MQRPVEHTERTVCDLLAQIADSRHLERERGARGIASKLPELQLLQGSEDSETAQLLSGVLDLLTATPWEHKLGGLLAAKAILLHLQQLLQPQPRCRRDQQNKLPPSPSPTPAPPPCAPPSPPADAPPSPAVDPKSGCSSSSSRPAGLSAWQLKVQVCCLALLEDEEPRVRLAAGQVLGGLASLRGVGLWREVRAALLRSITDHLDRDCLPALPSSAGPEASTPHNNSSSSGPLSKAGRSDSGGVQQQQQQQQQQQEIEQQGQLEQQASAVRGGAAEPGSLGGGTGREPGPGTSSRPVAKELEQPAASGGGAAAPPAPPAPDGGLLHQLLAKSYTPLVPGQGHMRHGTEGWRCLESSMRALVAVLEGVTPASHLSPLLTPELRDLVGGCMHHPNRYVREAAHAAAAVMCEVLAAGGQGQGGVAVHAGPGDHLGAAQLTGQPALTRGAGHQDTQHAWAHEQQAQHQQREKPPPPPQQQQQQEKQQQQQGQQEQHDGQGGLEEPVVSVAVSQESRGRGGAADLAAGAEAGQGGEELPLALQQLAQHFAPLLADGLTDNWSQVRYAAAVAARSVLLCLGSDEAREPLLRHLLPPLCLNRYYPAEGVREFSQASWQIVFRTLGRAAVARHIDAVVPYYIAQSKAVNHGVREAACACMAELAEKVERGAVQPHLPLMQRALLLCFKDMAWPVRDAACTASARCLLAYPEDCRPFLPELLQLWTAHLWDNVQSVRENSARALGDALRAVPGSEPGTPLAAVQSTLSEYLPMSQQQPREPVRGRQLQRFGSPTSERPPYPSGAAGSQKTTGSVSASVTAGVVETPQSSSSPRRRALGRPRTSSPSAGRRLSPARAWEQDVKAALAQDQDMFSGGEDWTLFSDAAATRFSAASYIRGDGCMDFGFSREQAPWEACDGAVYMVRELASVLPQAATDWLPQLAEQAAQAEGFDAAPRLRESVWKCLPTIAQHIGKQTLKRYLDAFLRPLFADLSCGCALTEVAAGKAIARMRDLLGAKIFAARLSETQAHELWTNPLIEPAKCSYRIPSANGCEV